MAEMYYYIPESWVVKAIDFDEAKSLTTNLLRTQNKVFDKNKLIFIVNKFHYESLCFHHGEPEVILGGE